MPTVLVVDDEQLIRWSLSERFTAEGCTIIEVGTAREALERFGANIDLVLLDYRLPDSDGLRVLKKMKVAQPDVPNREIRSQEIGRAGIIRIRAENFPASPDPAS